MVVYVSGGGVYNLLLMKIILVYCLEFIVINNIDLLGINLDVKEVVLFVILVNECLLGG